MAIYLSWISDLHHVDVILSRSEAQATVSYTKGENPYDSTYKSIIAGILRRFAPQNDNISGSTHSQCYSMSDPRMNIPIAPDTELRYARDA